MIRRVLNEKAAPDEAAEVAAWFATDEGQAWLAAEFDNDARQLESGAMAPLSDIPGEELLRRIELTLARARRRRALFRVAAILIPCALILGLWANLNSRLGGALFSADEQKTVAAAVGERKEVIFQDGTRIFLNAGSTISYPERFGLSERRVQLDGEAYFEVAHNPRRPFVVETSDNLCGRFKDSIGCIRSWDFGPWNFPVIIDNMMNLDLLFTASKLTGDSKYKDIAVRHADHTMANHFRPDYTCWHVVSYNDDGTVELKQTFQGKNDDSSWARGQAWAVYGYTSCYRETGDEKYLDFACKIADMIMSKVVAEDAVPYWDYDAPVTNETPRDASAGAVTACAMLELSTMVPDGQKYFDYGEKILKSLSSDAYLAAPGTNQGFVLMHSTGSLPNGSEIDVPLNYADYYYLEGLKRYMDLKGLSYSEL